MKNQRKITILEIVTGDISHQIMKKGMKRKEAKPKENEKSSCNSEDKATPDQKRPLLGAEDRRSDRLALSMGATSSRKMPRPCEKPGHQSFAKKASILPLASHATLFTACNFEA